MAFFVGIAGPWIVLMILDLMATRRALHLSTEERSQGWQGRLEHLLRRRETPSRA
ncbi:hypothetical protein [Methylobacterium soli]|uniref:hypothetical protein n=1 Tax=Methylobacterium soli TaxID=553447 RepID=UPI00178605E7|nr:hypothetical protein [Methylobacterium soli]GJE43268.1 hypothetical protein AEGHOMDF_2447 [Methylobacterium soli]